MRNRTLLGIYGWAAGDRVTGSGSVGDEMPSIPRIRRLSSVSDLHHSGTRVHIALLANSSDFSLLLASAISIISCWSLTCRSVSASSPRSFAHASRFARAWAHRCSSVSAHAFLNSPLAEGFQVKALSQSFTQSLYRAVFKPQSARLRNNVCLRSPCPWTPSSISRAVVYRSFADVHCCMRTNAFPSSLRLRIFSRSNLCGTAVLSLLLVSHSFTLSKQSFAASTRVLTSSWDWKDILCNMCEKIPLN